MKFESHIREQIEPLPREETLQWLKETIPADSVLWQLPLDKLIEAIETLGGIFAEELIERLSEERRN